MSDFVFHFNQLSHSAPAGDTMTTDARGKQNKMCLFSQKSVLNIETIKNSKDFSQNHKFKYCDK